MRRYLLAFTFIFTISGCGASVSDAVTMTTEKLQPVVDETRELCVLARDLARYKQDVVSEALVTRYCTDIWEAWNAIREVQDALVPETQP